MHPVREDLPLADPPAPREGVPENENRLVARRARPGVLVLPEAMVVVRDDDVELRAPEAALEPRAAAMPRDLDVCIQASIRTKAGSIIGHFRPGDYPFLALQFGALAPTRSVGAQAGRSASIANR